ncbi:hypothetical protein, partial [Porphyromonas cangingivalis]|uniref:hypothetical protein n=1 Tax=Porphyromonas cangingivalis TaxID=36874 RepID=UPI0024331343
MSSSPAFVALCFFVRVFLSPDLFVMTQVERLARQASWLVSFLGAKESLGWAYYPRSFLYLWQD